MPAPVRIGSDVDRQLAQQHQDRDEADDDGHQPRQNPAERRRAPLPFEVGRRLTPRELELQVLDRQIRRADHDERADDDEDEVDAVRDQPVRQQPQIPTAAR